MSVLARLSKMTVLSLEVTVFDYRLVKHLAVFVNETQ